MEESWPQHFNYSISISRHTDTLSIGTVSWMHWLRLSERGWWRLKRKMDRRRAKHIKERSEIKRWKGGMRNPLVFSHKTILNRSPSYHHLQCFILICLLPLLVADSVSLPYFSRADPLLFSHQINNIEDDAEARHRYLSLRLRPPKIRNSPLIWNKWPSSGKPKPPDSAAWFINDAWSRKLVQTQQKLKLCPHAIPNWRWGLKSTILTESLTKINK